MKEKYAKDLIDNINRRYNGRIIEIEEQKGLLIKWAVEINNYVLTFTDYENSEYFLSNQQIINLQNSGYTVIPVYLEDRTDNERLVSSKAVVISYNDKKFIMVMRN